MDVRVLRVGFVLTLHLRILCKALKEMRRLLTDRLVLCWLVKKENKKGSYKMDEGCLRMIHNSKYYNV